MENFAHGHFYFRYQKIFQTFDNLSSRLTRKFVAEKLSSSPWLYCKDLVGHFGCVNAIEFSNNGGEYLASGGDDTRILVWKIAEAVKSKRITAPRCLKSTHLSNIFCVAFDSGNDHVISAGNDDQILVHDFERGDLSTSLVASDATYHISIHPENDSIIITAGEMGVIGLYDLRTPADVVELARGPPAYHSAIFNPVDPSVFVTASSVRGIELWDSRAPMRCLKRFDGGSGVQCAMGVAFDQTGQYLTAVRRKMPPVLYHIRRNTSLVEFHQEGYYNSCTMKSVCFGGINDNFIMSGSDDFNVYIWEVPFVEQNHEGIARVEKSFLKLHGHRSIVNQVCFNNSTSMLCTAGVEKIIKMWSPFPFNGEMNEGYIGSQRIPYSRMEYARMIIESGRPLSHDYDDESTSEDPRMIAFFDSLVQKEREDSSSSSDPSSDDEDSEVRATNVDILRRIREIVFGQLRSERGQEQQAEVVSSTDSSRTASPERDSDSEDSNTDLATSSETPSSSNVNVNEMPQGVGLNRLREIIASQQTSVTNTQRRIAALRRECLTDEDNEQTQVANSSENSPGKNLKENVGTCNKDSEHGESSRPCNEGSENFPAYKTKDSEKSTKLDIECSGNLALSETKVIDNLTETKQSEVSEKLTTAQGRKIVGNSTNEGDISYSREAGSFSEDEDKTDKFQGRTCEGDKNSRNNPRNPDGKCVSNVSSSSGSSCTSDERNYRKKNVDNDELQNLREESSVVQTNYSDVSDAT